MCILVTCEDPVEDVSLPHSQPQEGKADLLPVIGSGYCPFLPFPGSLIPLIFLLFTSMPHPHVTAQVNLPL